MNSFKFPSMQVWRALLADMHPKIGHLTAQAISLFLGLCQRTNQVLISQTSNAPPVSLHTHSKRMAPTCARNIMPIDGSISLLTMVSYSIKESRVRCNSCLERSTSDKSKAGWERYGFSAPFAKPKEQEIIAQHIYGQIAREIPLYPSEEEFIISAQLSYLKLLIT